MFGKFGMFFLLTQYLQLVLGYTALEAGLRTLPMPFTMMLVAPNSARIVERLGARRVIVTGLLLVTAGLGSLSFLDVGTGYPQLAASLVVLALGMGLTMPPSTTLIMSSLPLGKAGVDPDLVVDLLVGPLFYRRLLAHEPVTAEYVGSVVDTVLAGLRPT
ncbi:MAG: MFS transporter [Actinomycetota bacterium]|nr:MFS transporter [Actinomycetota bacterium]